MRRDPTFSQVTSAAFLVALLIFILCAVGFGQTTNPSSTSENLIRRAEGSATTASNSAKPQANRLDLPRVALSLTVVIALIYGTRWTLKRIAPSTTGATSSRAVQVLSR